MLKVLLSTCLHVKHTRVRVQKVDQCKRMSILFLGIDIFRVVTAIPAYTLREKKKKREKKKRYEDTIYLLIPRRPAHPDNPQYNRNLPFECFILQIFIHACNNRFSSYPFRITRDVIDGISLIYQDYSVSYYMYIIEVSKWTSTLILSRENDSLLPETS